MIKKICLFMMLLAFVSWVSGLSFANAVSIGNSTNGDVLFSNNAGTTSMSFTGTNCGLAATDCLKGFGLYGADAGVYQMWLTGGNPILQAPIVFDVYPIDMNGATLHFDFDLLFGLGDLQGTIVVDFITGSTIAPEMIGNFTTTAASGLFAGVWRVGQTTDADFVVNLSGGSHLISYVFLHPGTSTQGPLSSGEIVSGTPEPSSLALLGSGLLTAAGILKRRLR
jgi:hypothetical protein